MKDWLQMDRREFLAALGATYGAATSAWAAPRSWFVDYAREEGRSPRERFVNTLCPMCPGGCGLKIRVVHGCAVGIRGNENHPISQGGLCSRAFTTLQDFYNPDRLRNPLRCIGGRGSNRWEEIDWDTAITMMTDKLAAIRSHNGPRGLSVVLGRDRGLSRSAWKRFMKAFGSPNLIDAYPDDNLGVLPAVLATHGSRQRIGYDIAKASYVLSFSSHWLDAHWSSVQAARAFAEFRRGRPGFRPKWVHIEPRYSLTAAKANEWLGIIPGTEGTLALGIAHVMLREGLYDRDFVDQHGFGFEDWVDEKGTHHLGYRRMVLQDYAPSRVEAVTGVPQADIFRLAREFSANRPALALGFDGGGCGAQATYDRMAIHGLNALVGSIDVAGGVTMLENLPVLEAQDETLDEVATQGLSHARLDGSRARRRLGESAIDLLADSISNGRPYPTEALFLMEANPVFSLADGARWGAALSSIPFIAAFSDYHNDTNRHADLILPTLPRLQRWDFNVAHTLTGHPVVTIAKPVIEPPRDRPDPYEVIRSIAKRLGGSIERALPWSHSKEAVEALCRELHRNRKGAAFGPPNEERWAQSLERRGWQAPFAEHFEDFQQAVLAAGGWTDPIYDHPKWDRVFQSPARKFAFSSAYLAHSFETMGVGNGASDHDRQCLPFCRTEKRSPDASYPLALYVYALPNLVGVSSPNLPWLNNVAGAYMFEKWRTWAEVHPTTAARFGLANEDQVEIQTSQGKLILPVKIYAGLVPDVIAIPFGLGHKTGGRWCAGVGENPAVLVAAQTDPLTGTSLWTNTRASIRKV